MKLNCQEITTSVKTCAPRVIAQWLPTLSYLQTPECANFLVTDMHPVKR